MKLNSADGFSMSSTYTRNFRALSPHPVNQARERYPGPWTSRMVSHPPLPVFRNSAQSLLSPVGSLQLVRREGGSPPSPVEQGQVRVPEGREE